MFAFCLWCTGTCASLQNAIGSLDLASASVAMVFNRHSTAAAAAAPAAAAVRLLGHGVFWPQSACIAVHVALGTAVLLNLVRYRYYATVVLNLVAVVNLVGLF